MLSSPAASSGICPCGGTSNSTSLSKSGMLLAARKSLADGMSSMVARNALVVRAWPSSNACGLRFWYGARGVEVPDASVVGIDRADSVRGVDWAALAAGGGGSCDRRRICVLEKMEEMGEARGRGCARRY